MRKRIAVAVGLSVFIFLIAFGVIRAIRTGDTEVRREGGVAVVVGRPLLRTLEEVLRYPGTLVPTRTVTVVPRIAGRVESIHVKEGDRVSTGQLLVTLDAESVSLQAEQAYAAWQAAEAQLRRAERGVRAEELENLRATVLQAESDFKIAEANLERSRRLFEAGAISRAKYEESESALRSAQTQLENAIRSLKMVEQGATTEDLDAARSQAEALKAQYDLAELQVGNAMIRSSSSGTVARILIDPGNLAGAGTPILSLVDEDPILARMAVPERHYRRFVTPSAGAGPAGVPRFPVRVYPVAFGPSTQFTGVVRSVATLIDPESRTFVVEAAIPNPQGSLRPGMYVNTEIVVEVRDEAITIPESALARRQDRWVVFLLEGDNSKHAMMRVVETGLRSGGLAEVLSGVAPDERIVIRGNAFLEDGQIVRVVNEQ